MKTRKLLSVIAWAALTAISAAAQSLPVATIAGTDYYYYVVKNNNESLYAVARQIGINEDVIVKYNPDAVGGLTKKQALFVPRVQTSPSQQVSAAFAGATYSVPESVQTTRHTIEAGETVYSIAKRFNTSIEGLFAANPRLTPDEYVEGANIKVRPGTAMPFIYDRETFQFRNYTVQDGDSYSTIAHRHGISEADVRKANPEVNKPKKGKTIVVPTKVVERVQGTMATTPLNELEAYYAPRLNDIYASVAKRAPSSFNIGLILPFQLHKEDPPRQAYLYTDFYKGLILALDSAGSQMTTPLNFTVWDTEHNLNVTDSLLALPQMAEMNLLIAPSEPQQLQRINRFAKQNDIPVLNCFTTKNEDYLNNPSVLQVNTPTDVLMRRLTEWFSQKFEGYDVIFLGNPNDNNEMFNAIKGNLLGKGIYCSTVNVTGELSAETLSREMMPASKYVIIPSSGSDDLLRKIVKAVKSVKKERIDCELVMLGYPEYVLHLKDYQEDLMTIDTYMFSRFFDTKGFRTRNINELYKRRFNSEILSSIPNMGLFGFDTGMFLINTLGKGQSIDENTPLYRGIQTGFQFEPVAGGGFVNRTIDIIHFSTDHKITANIL